MEYLVFLQHIRETCPEVILRFMVVMSEISVYGLPVFLCVMYWCVDKAFATVAMIDLAAGTLINNFLKLCFSVFRPWVRDPRIRVAKAAAPTAQGYSFPSGHSTSAGAVFMATLEEYGKKTWLKAVCIAFMILIPFSRMFLGCHTLEDVIFGLLLGMAMVFLGKPLFRWGSRSGRNRVLFLLLNIVICALMIVMVETRGYPMDTAADGSLLVDPETMKPGFYGACGMAIGWAVCWPLEMRYVRFEMPASGKEAWVRGILGVLLFLLVFFGIKKLGTGWDKRAEQFLRFGITVIVAGVVYPLFFRKLQAALKR